MYKRQVAMFTIVIPSPFSSRYRSNSSLDSISFTAPFSSRSGSGVFLLFAGSGSLIKRPKNARVKVVSCLPKLKVFCRRLLDPIVCVAFLFSSNRPFVGRGIDRDDVDATTLVRLNCVVVGGGVRISSQERAICRPRSFFVSSCVLN